MIDSEVRAVIASFIRSHFVYDDSKILSDDESFLSSGILDSTGVLELIAFLEETYHVHFDDEELVAENFDSLSRLTRFMVSKLDSKSE